MVATPARIGFITEQFRRATAETAEALTRHGDLARESDDPIETFFDEAADAALVAQARQSLLGVEARRFDVQVNGLDEALALSYTTGVIPNAAYSDSEMDANALGPITSISLDFSAQSASLPIWTKPAV